MYYLVDVQPQPKVQVIFNAHADESSVDRMLPRINKFNLAER